MYVKGVFRSQGFEISSVEVHSSVQDLSLPLPVHECEGVRQGSVNEIRPGRLDAFKLRRGLKLAYTTKDFGIQHVYMATAKRLTVGSSVCEDHRQDLHHTNLV